MTELAQTISVGQYRALAAETLGSMLLAATVIGSGIMAERLAGGNMAVALLANTAATVGVLATLIALFGPISGAHFNPAVSIVETIRGKLTCDRRPPTSSCRSRGAVWAQYWRTRCSSYP